MKNRDIYQRDPSKITLLNNGVATMTDALTEDERRTLRFEASGPVAAGSKVQLDGRDVGDVLNVAGNQLLAVVPVDKADDELTVGEARLTNLPLP